MPEPPSETPSDTAGESGPATPEAALRSSPSRLSAPVAALFAWLGLAAVNAIAIAGLSLPAGGLRVRALHHFYDAGHLAAMGLLACAITAAWGRFGPPRARSGWALGALAASSAAASMIVLPRDLAGLAERLTADGPAEPLASILAASVSLCVPAALAAGWLLARPKVRWLGVALAALGGAANTLVLQNDYPGVHFFLAWTSATLGAASITGAALPRRLTTPAPRVAAGLTARTSRVVAGLTAALAIVAVTSVVVWPRSAVLIELYRLDSAVVVPLLARVRARASARTAAVPPEMRPWFADRSAAPDVPPSRPALLPPDGIVVLVTIDSLRADVLAGEANRAALPNLFRLRDQGVSFHQARSPGSGTRITLGTVFSGRYYSQLRWTNPLAGRPKLDKDASARFPEILAGRGVATVTYVSEIALESKVGIARGFTEERWFDPIPGQKFALSSELVAAAEARLRSHREGPLFLYMHLMDPHAPYDAAGTHGTPRERYLREVALVDRALGGLLRTLDETGLAARTAVIVTADHGEAFGQHNTPHHNATLYEELLRVPLMIRAPGVLARRVTRIVSLVDLGPTVLDLMGVPTPGSFMGESLTPYLRGEDPVLTRPLVAEKRYAQAMLLPGGYKAILDGQKGTEEIYALERDPLETDNQCDELGDACAARLDVLRAFFLVHARWR